jgi:hypothetical protein
MPGQHERTEPAERDLSSPDAAPGRDRLGLVAQGDARETDRSPWHRYGALASAAAAVAAPPGPAEEPREPKDGASRPAESAALAADVTGEGRSAGNPQPAGDDPRAGGEAVPGDDSGSGELAAAGGPPGADGAATDAGDSVGQGGPATAKAEPADHGAGPLPGSGPGAATAESSEARAPNAGVAAADVAPADVAPPSTVPPSTATATTAGAGQVRGGAGHASAGMPGPVSPRPPRGSLADLRQRLEELPFGHPSSPYHVDGERKSPPPRLRHLELAPPQQARTVAGPVLAAASGQRQVDADADGPGTPDADGGWLDLALRTPDWEDVPALLTMTAAPPDPADLTEDQRRLADEAYDRLRAAEGRDLFGADTGTGLTAAIRRVSEQLAHGTLAPDSEQHALIGPEEFRARYADMIRRHPERSAESLADRVPGALSYSFVLNASLYAAGIWLVQDALEAAGFQLRARRNGWNGATDKCVVTLWLEPDSGVLFSVQFHTAASLEAQHLARMSAALIADPRIPRAEAENLAGDLAEAWQALPAPPGTSHISDYADSPGPGLS